MGFSDDELEQEPESGREDAFGNIDFDEDANAESEDELLPDVEEAPPVSNSIEEDLQRTPVRRASSISIPTSRERSTFHKIPLRSTGESPQTHITASPDKISGEEEDEIFRSDRDPVVLKKGRRKKPGYLTLSGDELLNKVSSLVSRMEDAASRDIESNEKGEPALEKYKMLEEVEEACIHREMQSLLLNEGLLGVLKSWIEPLNDGTLPNVRIRETVLKILLKLPIDTAEEMDRKMLKLSQIGSRVKFLSRIDDETRENRRMAFALVQKWSRPILEEARQYDDGDRTQVALRARRKRLEIEQAEEERLKKFKTASGDYRYPTARPMPNRDYVIKPKSRIDVSTASGHKKNVMIQKLNKMKRNKTAPPGGYKFKRA